MPGCGFPGLKGRTHISLLFLFFYHLVMKRYGVRLFLRRLTAGFFLSFLLSQSGQIRVNEIKKINHLQSDSTSGLLYTAQLCLRANNQIKKMFNFKHFVRIFRSLVTVNQESNRNLLKTRLIVETRKRTFFNFHLWFDIFSSKSGSFYYIYRVLLDRQRTVSSFADLRFEL